MTAPSLPPGRNSPKTVVRFLMTLFLKVNEYACHSILTPPPSNTRFTMEIPVGSYDFENARRPAAVCRRIDRARSPIYWKRARSSIVFDSMYEPAGKYTVPFTG